MLQFWEQVPLLQAMRRDPFNLVRSNLASKFGVVILVGVEEEKRHPSTHHTFVLPFEGCGRKMATGLHFC